METVAEMLLLASSNEKPIHGLNNQSLFSSYKRKEEREGRLFLIHLPRVLPVSFCYGIPRVFTFCPHIFYDKATRWIL